jgi:hypothetical protein
MTAEENMLEMYLVGCEFAGCADFCMKEAGEVIPQFLLSPVVVNAAFACEVFLKLLLKLNGIENQKIHKLQDLYNNLPRDTQVEIQNGTVLRCGKWTDIWGFECLGNVSDAFVEWRYAYEHDWSKSACMSIDVGFLIGFMNSLRDLCNQRFSWMAQSKKEKL